MSSRKGGDAHSSVRSSVKRCEAWSDGWVGRLETGTPRYPAHRREVLLLCTYIRRIVRAILNISESDDEPLYLHSQRIFTI